jgi:hypothetical protein
MVPVEKMSSGKLSWSLSQQTTWPQAREYGPDAIPAIMRMESVGAANKNRLKIEKA